MIDILTVFILFLPPYSNDIVTKVSLFHLVFAYCVPSYCTGTSKVLLHPQKCACSIPASQRKMNQRPRSNRQSWTNWTLPRSSVKWVGKVSPTDSGTHTQETHFIIKYAVKSEFWKIRNFSTWPRQLSHWPWSQSSQSHRNTWWYGDLTWRGRIDERISSDLVSAETRVNRVLFSMS